MTKHTHKGTCQVCGYVQAVNNKTGRLAKHGYSVEWGYFSGTCAGSDETPLEISSELTESTIENLNRLAYALEQKTIADIDEVIVETYDNGIRRKENRRQTACRDQQDVDLATGVPGRQSFEDLAKLKLLNLQNQAKHMRRHVADLAQLIDERHGQPLFEVKRLEEEATQAKAAKAAKPTKASVKRITDDLNRQYARLIEEPKKAARLAQDRARMTELSDLPFSLYQWRAAKHDSIVGVELAAQIADLLQRREQAKALLS